MAQPASRQDLIDYALRQNGAPVLEINVAEEQLQDLTDDAIQYYQERHFNSHVLILWRLVLIMLEYSFLISFFFGGYKSIVQAL